MSSVSLVLKCNYFSSDTNNKWYFDIILISFFAHLPAISNLKSARMGVNSMELNM